LKGDAARMCPIRFPWYLGFNPLAGILVF